MRIRWRVCGEESRLEVECGGRVWESRGLRRLGDIPRGGGNRRGWSWDVGIGDHSIGENVFGGNRLFYNTPEGVDDVVNK